MRKLLLSVALGLVLLMLQASIAAAAPPSSGGFWHRVKYGESLSSIGWRYGVNPFRICSANSLANCNIVRAGQRLWIPSGSSAYHRPYHRPYHQPYHRPYHRPTYRPTYHPYYGYHTVKPGQTLYGISRAYGVNPWTIARANHLYNVNHIYAGQHLYIPNYW